MFNYHARVMFIDKLSTLFSQAALRLERMPGYTLLSMLGLVLSLSGTVIIARYLHQEWTIDHWMPERERICRVMSAEYDNKEQQRPSLMFAHKKMEGRQPITDMEGIEAVTDVHLRSLITVKLEDDETFTVCAISADSDFVRVFPLQAAEGKRDENAAAETDLRTYKETQYDLLADTLRRHLDMKRIYEIIMESENRPADPAEGTFRIDCKLAHRNI